VAVVGVVGVVMVEVRGREPAPFPANVDGRRKSESV
jgi:hypothetical protein